MSTSNWGFVIICVAAMGFGTCAYVTNVVTDSDKTEQKRALDKCHDNLDDAKTQLRLYKAARRD